MNLRNLHILCLLVVGFMAVFTACDTAGNLDSGYGKYFVKYYGEAGNQEGIDLVVNESDESIVLLGTTTIGQTSRIFLVKTDWSGNVLWKYHLGGPHDVAKDLEAANDGGYVILSETQGTDGDVDIKVTKITFDGVATDSIIYGHPGKDGRLPNEFPETITAFGDSYMVTGSTDRDTTRASPGIENLSDVFYMHLDENLDTLFTGVNSEGQTEYGLRSVKTSDNLFYMLGSSFKSSSDGNGVNDNFNFWFFPITGENLPAVANSGAFGDDNSGNNEVLKAVCPALTPGLFFVGAYTNSSSGANDIYVAWAYESGNQLYKSGNGTRIMITRSWGDRRAIEPVAVSRALVGNGYLILGNEGESNARNIWITKVNDAGGVVWSASLGASGGNNDAGGAIAELPDGSVVVVGTINLGDESILKMALFRLNAEGKFAR